MRLLLDTNVLIDYFAMRQPYYPDALRLRVAQAFGDVELWACGQSFVDIGYILRRAIPHERLMSQLRDSLQFIHLVSPQEAEFAHCLDAPWADFEDQILEQAAQRVQADCLVTRNGADFAQGKTPVRTPAEVLALLEQQGFTYDSVLV